MWSALENFWRESSVGERLTAIFCAAALACLAWLASEVHSLQEQARELARRCPDPPFMSPNLFDNPVGEDQLSLVTLKDGEPVPGYVTRWCGDWIEIGSVKWVHVPSRTLVQGGERHLSPPPLPPKQ
jgi:hypothetical protein